MSRNVSLCVCVFVGVCVCVCSRGDEREKSGCKSKSFFLFSRCADKTETLHAQDPPLDGRLACAVLGPRASELLWVEEEEEERS